MGGRDIQAEQDVRSERRRRFIRVEAPGNGVNWEGWCLVLPMTRLLGCCRWIERV